MTIEQNISSESVNADIEQQRDSPLLALLSSSAVSTLLYLVILVVAPVPELQLASTPLSASWSWLLAPSRFFFPAAWSASGTSSRSLLLLLLGTILIALAVTYLFTIRSVERAKSSAQYSTRWLFLLLGGTLVSSLPLLLQPALFSGDVFTFLFSGRILAVHHADPLNTAPSQFLNDPYLRWVIVGRNTSNFYGPLLLSLSLLLAGLGNGADPIVTFFLFKGIIFASHLINILLVWAILGKIAPSRRLPGTLLYAWNPLALLELAGSAHNEGILLTMFLLAFWLHIQQEKRWYVLGALAAFGLAVSTDLIALLIIPLYLWFTLRTERNIARAIKGFGWRMLFVLGCAIVIILPYWRGATTFLAITSAFNSASYTHSLLESIAGPTRWFFGLVAEASHFPSIMQPTTAADITLRASSVFILAIIYIHHFGHVRNAPIPTKTAMTDDLDEDIKQPGLAVLLNSWGTIFFCYLVFVAGEFWPWYLMLVLWIVALRRLDTKTMTVLLLSGTALLIYPLQALLVSPIVSFLPILIFGIPLVYFIIYRDRQRRIV